MKKNDDTDEKSVSADGVSVSVPAEKKVTRPRTRKTVSSADGPAEAADTDAVKMTEEKPVRRRTAASADTEKVSVRQRTVSADPEEKAVRRRTSVSADTEEKPVRHRTSVSADTEEQPVRHRTSLPADAEEQPVRRRPSPRRTAVSDPVSSDMPAASNASAGYVSHSEEKRTAYPSLSDTAVPASPSVQAPFSSYTPQTSQDVARNLHDLDSHEKAEGILEIMADGFGFIRSNGYLPGEDDIYVAPSQIKRFNLKTGDHIIGNKRVKGPTEKFSAILFIEKINGVVAEAHSNIVAFESLTPIFPHERLHLETDRSDVSMRITDLISPVGKGQRGMIVAQPKVGKTTLLKQIAHALLKNHPELHLIILLIDERPEEVTDMQESIVGDNVEIVFSTFDEQPEHHKRVSEMVIERAKRLVEMHRDVVILLDSITRLTRAYNLTVTPSGRTLSGGLDPAALYMPKRFFGAARCMREGGSLTILATALLETGSRLDDMVYEEFKGTGNMELVLNRNLSERRIFPAIDIQKSSTRRDDLLLTAEESDAVTKIRRVSTLGLKQEEAMEQILNLFASTKSNDEFIRKLKYVVL